MNKKAQAALDALDCASWPMGAQVKLGAALIKCLLETACWTHEKTREGATPWDGDLEGVAEGGEVPQPAFVHNVISTKKNKRQGALSLAPEIYAKAGVAKGFVNVGGVA